MGKNIFGTELISCSLSPKTGFYRDGCCNTDSEDHGVHTVCSIMTKEFLEFSKSRGNDLSTPRPQWNFPGLKPGDRWCLCAPRWMEAYKAGKAPGVKLQATHEKTLEFVEMEMLLEYGVKE